MRVVLTFLLAAFTTCVAAHALDIRESELHRLPPNLAGRSALPQHKKSLPYARSGARLTNDGAARGFFDEDYASEADWTKFTNKGGALVDPYSFGEDVN